MTLSLPWYSRLAGTSATIYASNGQLVAIVADPAIADEIVEWSKMNPRELAAELAVARKEADDLDKDLTQAMYDLHHPAAPG